MLLIFAGAAQPITDTDFWWHLRTGQHIVKTKSIPHADIFSTIAFGKEWVAHEWLAEVVTYSIFRMLGLGGVIVVFSLILTTAFWITYERCRKRTGHPYFAVFAVLLGAVASISTWGVRPHIISLLFASIFISFLDRYSRREEMASIWWLAPLMVLWANMHAGYVLGLALIALTIVGLSVNRFLVPSDRQINDWRRVKLLCWLLIVCAALVMVNPNGARMYSYPFETFRSPAMMRYIEEWKSPNFHEARFQGLALLLLATFCALALSKKRARPSELLFVAFGAWATLRSARNVWFFALVAIPQLAEHSWIWVTSYGRWRWLTVAEKRDHSGTYSFKLIINVALLMLCTTLVILGVQRAIAKQPAIDAQEFPVAAIDFLRSQKLARPIFNEYDWGGYLIWTLYPEYRVYIDGRADVYGDQMVEEFLRAHDGKPGWRELLERDGIHTVLIRPDIPLASLLRIDTAWQKVFEDKQAVIFVRCL